ncbi:MAG TPA: hypothetical protein PKE55_05340 [Kiritimatiellia bacterium]|nr:hypothetical protein [Kiritimatiellia bacterium]
MRVGVRLGCLVAMGLLVVSEVEGQSRATVRWVRGELVEAGRFSEEAQEFLGAFGEGMVMGESRNFFLAGPRGAEVRRMGEAAEAAWGRVSEWLGLEEGGEKRLLVLVGSEEGWTWLSRRYGLRGDGLAFQRGNEVFLRDDADGGGRPDRFAHEVVHVGLAEFCGAGLPPWLEEGLAMHWGWILAVEFAEGREMLSRTWKGLERREVVSLSRLTEARRMPSGAREAQAFYRQAEEAVRELEEQLGREGLVRLAEGLCGEGMTLIKWLREVEGWSRGEVRGFERRVGERCRTAGSMP